MTDKIKATGVTGRLLHAMADRGGDLTTDCRGFPPSKVMLPLKRRGLVVLNRTRTMKSRGIPGRNIWYLTQKAWDRISRSKPVYEETE
jgi:hypothetical protein